MIGDIRTGASFYHCMSYCLEDKRELTEEQKSALSRRDNVQHKNRAEVLEYNLCFGDKTELASQFREVRMLNRRIKKPLFHISLRLAPGDELTRDQLIEIGRACASEFGIADHQYICVLHKDTREQHIHIAANRVGFDGKVASDSQSYKRMADLCRRLEKQYGLTEVLSPRKFLTAGQRKLPRHDIRKEKLREDIRQTLQSVNSYDDFKANMERLGYKLIKARGIAFVDSKKVRIKGSEVGFSLRKIENIISSQRNPVDVQRPVANWWENRAKNFNTRSTVNVSSLFSTDTKSEVRDSLDALFLPGKEGDGDLPYPISGRRKKKKRRRRLSI